MSTPDESAVARYAASMAEEDEDLPFFDEGAVIEMGAGEVVLEDGQHRLKALLESKKEGPDEQ